MPKRPFYLPALVLSALPGLLHAHGMVYDIATRETVAIIAAYDDGEPMGYAAVKIFAPGDAQIEHQNGRTDKNGRFAFMPDTPGQWRIIVDGGMGHVINTTFEVDDALTVSADPAVSRPYSRAQDIMAGLGIIMGVTGVGFYLRARQPGARS